MAAEGLEKFSEVPVEFFKDGSAFVKKCTKPTKKGKFQGPRAVHEMGDLNLNQEVYVEQLNQVVLQTPDILISCQWYLRKIVLTFRIHSNYQSCWYWFYYDWYCRLPCQVVTYPNQILDCLKFFRFNIISKIYNVVSNEISGTLGWNIIWKSNLMVR